MADNSADDDKDTETAGGALLSPKQREWVEGGAPDPRGSSKHRNYRKRIIERVCRTFLDAPLLDNLPEEDLKKIFRNPSSEVSDGMFSMLVFIFRPYVHDIVRNPSESELTGSKARTAARATSETFEDFFGFVLGVAIERAIETEAPELVDQKWRQTEVSVDVDVSTTETERLNVIDAEHRLQSGRMDFQELREHFADGKLTMQEVQQLTRGEEIRGTPRDSQREEILDEPLPMLDGDLPDEYMRIALTNPHVTTTKLHDEQHMPPGYNVRFSDDRTAIVLREVGTNLIEAHEHIEAVGGTHTDPSGE
jgi:hypothetical protein